MNRTFITGDVHGGHDKDKLFNFYQKTKDLDLSDIMIVAGDWGYIWAQNPSNHEERKDKEKLSSKMTYFIVLGNHENYDRIEKLPTLQKFGNTVRYEPEHPNIFYALNGNFYEINSKKFWCMGGGFSIDKEWRKTGVSWWEQEVPAQEELDAACIKFLEYFKKDNNSLHYIVTHTCPLSLQPFDKFIRVSSETVVNRNLEIMLQKIWDSLPPEQKPAWYCGHFHTDEQREIRFLYQDILELK